MTINQCVKTGANVYLTAERVQVHGDLHVVLTDEGAVCVLHYVEPHQFIENPRDANGQFDPDRFDAVFDTEAMLKEDAVVRCSFLDLHPAKVMIMNRHFSYLHTKIRDALDKAVASVSIEHEEEDILTLLKQMGVSVHVVDLEKGNGN